MFDSFHPHCFYGPVTQRESARPASEKPQVQFLSGPPFGRVVEMVYTSVSKPGAERRAGSTPVLTTIEKTTAALAQLVERMFRKHEISGSSPESGSLRLRSSIGRACVSRSETTAF